MLAFSILSAGTDTTRNQLAACMHALCDHPDQLAMLRDNPDPRDAGRRGMHAPFTCGLYYPAHQSSRTSPSPITPFRPAPSFR